MRRILNIAFSDEGNISIDWMETTEMHPQGGTYRTTYVTLAGREASEHVEYYAKEIKQDADELLHHSLKMLEEQAGRR